MKTNDLILKRLTELADAGRQIKPTDINEYGSRTLDLAVWEKWATSVLNILQRAFSEDSAHYRNFSKAHTDFRGYFSDFQTGFAIFLSAKEDYEGGYILNLQEQISGEILGDFVGLAKSAFAEGYKDVAAVLASAALEDALKKLARTKGLDVGDRSMQEVVSALKTKGLVSGAQKSLLDTMPKLRDYAMHANWQKLSEADVNGLIGFVEGFITNNF
jgi:hypothetical protein